MNSLVTRLSKNHGRLLVSACTSRLGCYRATATLGITGTQHDFVTEVCLSFIAGSFMRGATSINADGTRYRHKQQTLN
jgi:RNase P/RNase MRP subunit POP5